MQTVTKCNLCGSSSFKKLFDATDRLHGKEGKFVYVKCNECGLVFQNPVLDNKELTNFYPEDYSPHQAKKTKSEKEKQKFKTKILEDVLKKLSSKSNLLDVGCGNGKFLYEIKKQTGCQISGVDFSKTAVKAVKASYNLDVFCGTVIESSFENNYFDIITAWSFIEHVNNPSEVLQKLYNMLKPGGNCILSCPNFNSFNAKVFKNKWYHLDCPRHLYIYTPKTITNLMEKIGFTVTKTIHEKTSKGLLGSLQYYIYGNNFNPSYRNKIRKSALLKSILSPLTRVIAFFKKADTIVVYAVKKEK